MSAQRDEWALRHLIASLFLGPKTPMAAITGIGLYCDASGKEHEEIIAVGGFVSTVEEWSIFDTKWRIVLDEEEIEYFRMSEFAHSVSQFEGWKDKDEKRIQFLDRLIKIIVKHTKYWMGACVLRSDYLKVDADWQLHEYLHPFPLCGKFCVDRTNTWYDAHHYDAPIEYIFESGDEHWGQLQQRVMATTGQEPISRKKCQATPCQAADVAAYEILKVYRFIELERTVYLKKHVHLFCGWAKCRTISGNLQSISCVFCAANLIYHNAPQGD